MKKQGITIFRRLSVLILCLVTALSLIFTAITYVSTTHFYQASTQLLNKDVAAHIAKFASPYEPGQFNKERADSITPVTGTPYTIPVGGGALGLWQHPTENILYVGFPTQAKVGVYDIDPASGGLSFVTSVSSGPAACWIRTNKAGSRLYALNSAENTISVFNSSSAQSPVLMDKFVLKNAGPLIPDGMGNFSTTSEDFSFEFSTDEKFLYVISQHTNKDFTIGNFNYFHVLSVSALGLLSEPIEPLPIPVVPNARPQGIAVYKAG